MTYLFLIINYLKQGDQMQIYWRKTGGVGLQQPLKKVLEGCQLKKCQ